MTPATFQRTILTYYRAHGRTTIPWRKTHDPYKILVSEIMLQQTQVSRVLLKYKSFLQKFPTVDTLAAAPLADVLREWQGLGYNRRGMYLKKCAEIVVKDFGGKFPKDLKILKSLPGIGPATAGDILAFAWNLPAVVIETNIRSVFIHFFFKDRTGISDKEILPFIERTLPSGNIREWYYALMDYGAYLKTSEKTNPSRRSKHHTKQSRFEGSHRQKRAALLKLLLEKNISEKELHSVLQFVL